MTEYQYFVFQYKTNLFQEFISTHEHSISSVLRCLMHGSLSNSFSGWYLQALSHKILSCVTSFNRHLCMLALYSLSYLMLNWLVATLEVHTNLSVVPCEMNFIGYSAILSEKPNLREHILYVGSENTRNICTSIYRYTWGANGNLPTSHSLHTISVL